MQVRILWAVVGGFLVGVLMGSFAPLTWPFAACAALLGVGLCAYGYLQKENLGVLCIVAVMLFAWGLGVVRVDSATQTGDGTLTALVGQKMTIRGVVTEEPDVRENNVRLSVRASELIGSTSTQPIHTGVLVSVPLHTPVVYGDVVEATGVLRLPEAFDTGQGHTFNYPEYLAKDGILYELAFASASSTGERSANLAKVFALSVKQVLLQGLRDALPEPEAGLAAGITLGDKRAGGSELSETFIRASLIHIVVLSGYNITVVINAASRMLSVLPRIFRFGTSGSVVVFFILMTGGAATAVRAGIMALLAVYARLSGRTFLALRALGVAAFAMVLWNPLTLAFDPSFQLSALATLGLVLFTPVVAARMQWVSEQLGLREIVCSTIATQITVLPLLLYQSGNLSLVALPANIFALSAVPFAMGFSGVAAIVGLIAPAVAVFIGLPAYLLLAYIIEIARLFASLPYASVSVAAFSFWWVCIAYGFLFGGLALLHRKENDRN